MRFITRLFSIMIMAMLLSACSTGETSDKQITSAVQTTAITAEITEQTTLSTSAEIMEQPIETITENEETTVSEPEQNMITITIGDNQAIIEMLDNDAAKNFMDMLPLTLTFEDYNKTEKISYLPEELTIGTSPTDCDPDIGTFAYFAPWGNLSVFYEDFRQSDSLVPLGTFESGIEFFSEMDANFTVTIERR